MAMGGVRWDGERFRQAVHAHMADNIEAAAIYLKGRIKKNISRAHNRYHRSKPRKGGVARRVGHDPSRPGEYPKKLSGTLRRNILHEANRAMLTARVGVARGVIYGKFLEWGTSRMKARPYLMRTLIEKQKTVRRIISRRMQS